MKDKVVISCSINKDVNKWLTKKAEEWRVSKSWLIENLLYSSMIRSGVLPDADEQNSKQY